MSVRLNLVITGFIMPKEFFEFDLSKPPGASWGLRIGGGVDRGKVIVIEKVIFNSVAYESGVKDRDYVVEVNGTKVFEMSQDDFKQMIKNAGDQIHLKVERGDHIVPNMDEAFPKKKSDEEPIRRGDKPYWMQALEEGKGNKRLNSGFTTVGKPKIAQKQYNSPLEMYSEEVLEEIMTSGTVGGKPVDPTNLMNPTGKELDLASSAVLALINNEA